MKKFILAQQQKQTETSSTTQQKYNYKHKQIKNNKNIANYVAYKNLNFTYFFFASCFFRKTIATATATIVTHMIATDPKTAARVTVSNPSGDNNVG